MGSEKLKSRIQLGIDYWCPNRSRNPPSEPEQDDLLLVLKGQGEVDPDRIAYFHDFCQSNVDRRRIRRLHVYPEKWILHEPMIPQIAQALQHLSQLQEIHFYRVDPACPIHHLAVRSVLEATQHVVQHVLVSEKFQTNTTTAAAALRRGNSDTSGGWWSSALPLCHQLRIFRFRTSNGSSWTADMWNDNGQNQQLVQHLCQLLLGTGTGTTSSRQSSLQSLTLPGVHLSDTVWSQFAAALQQSKLVHLTLREMRWHPALFGNNNNFPVTLQTLDVQGGETYEGFQVQGFLAALLQGLPQLQHINFQHVNLSCTQIVELLETKSKHVDRNISKDVPVIWVHRSLTRGQQDWQSTEIQRIASLLAQNPYWTELGYEWDTPLARLSIYSEEEHWQEVDTWLTLNRNDRAHVANLTMDPAVFLGRHLVLANYLFLRHDGVRLGWFSKNGNPRN